MSASQDHKMIKGTRTNFLQDEGLKNVFRALKFWLGFLVIVAVFTFFEFRLDVALDGSFRKIILILLLIIEFGLIMKWDNLQSQIKG